jgi:hypothetical protein
MDQMPMISPSSDAEWKRYYERKWQETDKQLKYIAWAFSHLLRFAMNGYKKDAHAIGRLVVGRLEYPRDKDQILKELAKWPEFAGSVTREE